MSGPEDLDELVAGVRSGDRAAISRALTLAEGRREDQRRAARELLARLDPSGEEPAIRVGISGLPGAGKSTLLETLGLRLVEEGRRVAVLAVDPTSSVSGGSILGDKTRMGRLARREEAFIRPSPSGESLGGVTATTREQIAVLEAAGFDVVFVETVGVGQREMAVARMVDTFVVLLVAGTGDELQGIKRGLLELAHVVAVNKADRDSAAVEAARRDVAAALGYLRSEGGWRPWVLTISGRTGEGVDDLWSTIVEHRRHLDGSGGLVAARRRQAEAWAVEAAEDRILEAFRGDPGVAAERPGVLDAVREGRMTPAEAADRLVRAFRAIDP